MSSTVLNITFDCADPRRVARFWGQVTGGKVIEAPNPGSPDCAATPRIRPAHDRFRRIRREGDV